MKRSALLSAVLVLIFGSLASAQIELGVGYSNVRLAGADDNLRDANGYGADLRIGGPILPVLLDQLRIGVDIGWRKYDTSGSGTSLFTPDKSDLNLFSGEARVAFRQPIGIFFIEPSVSGGVLVGEYSTNNHFNLTSFDQTATGWSIRPGLAAGIHIALFTAGVEASYRYGRLTFHNGAGGDLNEFYAGVFAGISF